jgi:photosystem II stability/assembly factor-like uncharacterized protein
MGARRSRVALLIFGLLLAVLVLGVPGVASATSSWTTLTVPTSDTWYGISFPDTQHGWAVGLNGNIIATSDGGQTWTAQLSGPSFWECDMVDATHGWAVGPSGVIYATTDGATWTPQTASVPGAPAEDVEAFDVSVAWIVGDDGLIMATVDGGATWTTQTSGVGETLNDVNVLDRQTAWAAGYNGVVLHTTDGGTTWTHQTISGAGTLFCIQFTDALHGWAAGSGGRIFATTDGGVTWAEQTSGTTGSLWRSAAFIGGRVWLVGGAGVLLTEDAGATWATQDVGSTATMWDCTFPLRGRGWVCGAGVILAYKEDYTLTASAGEHGAVSPAGATEVIAGTDTTYTFTPAAGYKVADVTVDGTSVGAPAGYTFADVTTSHTLAVAFAPADDNHPTCVVRGQVKGWSNRPVKLRITGVPGSYGYAVDFIGSALNGWVLAPKDGSELNLTVGDQGITKVKCFAADVNGNSSPTRKLAVRVDTRKPSVLARAASGTAGEIVRVPFKAVDAVPGCGFARVHADVVDAAGRVLTRASTRQVHVNWWRTIRMRTTSLTPGTYTVVLRAMDLAGNFQRGVTRTTLTVK